MSLPRGSALLLALGAIVSLACGGGEPRASAGASAVVKSTPTAAASPSTARPIPSPEGSKTGPADGLQKATFDPDAEYDKGAALAAARRFADARQVFEEAARLAPMDGSLAAAVAMFDDLAAKRISEDVVQRLFQAGQDANAERWAEAHADLDEAIRLAPGYARAHGMRGTLLLLQGKPADALKAFDQVLKLDPAFAEGYFNRGAVYAELRKYDLAIADYTRAIELQPDYWYAYANRGTAHLNRGLARDNTQDAQDAVADFTKAHELNPGAFEPLYQRGLLYALAEEWGAAAADFTAVIERNPGYALASYNRGLAYQNLGADDRAVADYTKAIELDPADPKPLINRGLLYAKQKSYERAIADADKAASLAPALLNAYYNKGLALEQMGRPKEAAAQYRILLQKAGPDDSALAGQARQRLAVIEKAPKD